ncbi:hypothetical protein AcV7_005079 [Taiwanofungus camphoratus]|nr:hypothetical protein AcV7_005079 [Antrodia cinnamomea]
MTDSYDIHEPELADNVPSLSVVRPWNPTPHDRNKKPPPPKHISTDKLCPNTVVVSTCAAPVLHIIPLKSREIEDVTENCGAVRNEAMTLWVQEHFRDKVYRGLPVRKFVHAVWDFTPDDIPVVPTPGIKSYTIPILPLSMYLRCAKESDGYPYLVAILQHLQRQVSLGNSPTPWKRKFSISERESQVEIKVRNMQERLLRGNYNAVFKPDLGWGTTTGNDTLCWDWHLSSMEIKKHEENPLDYILDIPFSTAALNKPMSIHSLQSESAPYNPSNVSSSAQLASGGNKRKGPPTVSEAVEPPQKRFRSGAHPDLRGGFAKHTNTGLNLSDQPRLTGNEVQAAKYINDMLSHGIRSYASGFMIDNTIVTLWYGDRMGIVLSKPFDFMEEPHMLLLAIAAITSANHAHLGICPFLKFPSGAYDSYSNVKLEVDDKLAFDADGRPLQKLIFGKGGHARSTSTINGIVRNCWTSQSACTDLLSIGGETLDDPAHILPTYGTISAEFGAVGRETTIVPIKATGAAATLFGQDDLVAKMAWPPKKCQPEDKFIRVIKQKIQQQGPRWLRHIVDLKCSITRRMDEMNFPRVHMQKLLDHEDRVFKIMVMKKYEALQLVDGAEEFKQIFVDVVSAHHWVWQTAGVLHRDISVGNIMFYRDENGCAIGILCDWDLAMFRPSKEEFEEDDNEYDENAHADNDGDILITARTATKRAELTVPQGSFERHDQTDGPDDTNGAQEQPHKRPRYRTGTGPFMALDLLSEGKAPLHRYRHDLESFFYVLAWVCAVFDPVRHKFGHFPDWESSNLITIGRNKRAFLRVEQEWQKMFSSAHPDYAALAENWVLPLRWEFLRILKESEEILDLRVEQESAQEHDGHLRGFHAVPRRSAYFYFAIVS